MKKAWMYFVATSMVAWLAFVSFVVALIKRKWTHEGFTIAWMEEVNTRLAAQNLKRTNGIPRDTYLTLIAMYEAEQQAMDVRHSEIREQLNKDATCIVTTMSLERKAFILKWEKKLRMGDSKCKN